jgi:hypothetical protein
MTDHPILFSGPMVRALLTGRKTQTRRIVSAQNLKFFNPERGRLESTPKMIEASFRDAHNFHRHDKSGGWNWQARAFDYQPGPWTRWQARSKIQVGDRLYVREAWQVWTELDGLSPSLIDPTPHVNYSADGRTWDSRRRAAMHMPRWASRLTLTVTDVRLQRLHEITEADALAEGVHFCPASDGFTVEEGTHYHGTDPRRCYESLWNTINDNHSPAGWNVNPWVLAYSFDVRRGNIDAVP